MSRPKRVASIDIHVDGTPETSTQEPTVDLPAEHSTTVQGGGVYRTVLAPYLRDGMLRLRVLVSHDALFAGDVVRVPPSERVAGLLEIGFLEIDFDD